MTYPICSEEFYNSDKVWKGWRPNPSSCLLFTIQMMPCIIIWIGAPFQLYRCFRVPVSTFLWTRIYIIRMIFVLVAMISITLDLCRSLYEVAIGKQVDLINHISPSVLLITTLFSGILFYAERRAHRCSSPVNLTFYALHIVATFCDIMCELFSYFAKSSNQPHALHTVSVSFNFVTSIIIFILVCFRDADSTTAESQEYACGMERASAFSRVTFSWLSSFMLSQKKKQLSIDNAIDLLPRDRCAANYGRFRYHWERLQKNISAGASLRRLTVSERSLTKYSKPSRSEVLRPPLLRILYNCVGSYVGIAWIFKFMITLLEFLDPWILNELINFTGDKERPVWNGAFYALTYLIYQMLATAFEHQAMYYSLIGGMRTRSMLIAAIYRKILRMSNDARSKASEGDIANLISVEVQKLCDIQESIWVVISALITTAICIPALWHVLGKSVLSGISFLFLLVPVCGYLIFFEQSIEEKETLYRDKRLNLLTEVFNGIKFLKLHAWEAPYERKITFCRQKELKNTRKVNFLNTIFEMLWTTAPFVVMLATFSAYLSSGHATLTAQQIFVTFSLINILRAPVSQLPWAISNIIDVNVSFKRISDFFMASDLDFYAKQSFSKSKGGTAILIEYASFAWLSKGPVILRDIDFKIQPGQLVAIFGKIGSGKSSLLAAILGEMLKLRGYVCTRGSFAYVPQDAWIQQMTVEDNILLGADMDTQWYDTVLDACALKPDLKLLDLGDETLIGEGGATLTTGQQQRINLARALYKNADIYLLDEPLSAIDSLVATQVFQQVIGRTGLLAKTTRIVATSQLQFLPLVDYVLVMKEGKIVERGPYDHLIARPDSLFSVYVEEQSRFENYEVNDSSDNSFSASAGTVPFRMSRRSTVFSRARTASFVAEFNILRTESSTSAPTGPSPRALLKSHYMARGWWFSAVVFLLCSAKTVFEIQSNFWLSNWSDDPRLKNLTISNSSSDLNYYYLRMYALFGSSEIVFAFAFNVLDAYSNTCASELLHTQMLTRMMRAPMSVFYVTPIGRIMNRFSGDIDIIDHELPNTLNELTESLFSIIGCICIICILLPQFLFVVVILMAAYFRIEMFYAAVVRQSRRLDFVTRSNLFTLFTETVQGAMVIRAFNKMNFFSRVCDDLTDDNARFYFIKVVCDRWLGVRLDLMAAVFVFMVMGMAILSRASLQPGVVGLALTYALQITDYLDSFVWQMAEVTAGTVAIERVKQFTEVEQEKLPDDPSFTDPGPDWPNKGHVCFKSACGSERNGLNPVLLGVNAEIFPGEHIGIVGRTGTGKSSLTRALFGLIDLDSGSIEVDDVDIKTIPLDCLRSRLTILPQDPILFTGTLRHNLDPLGQYKDEELWKVLRLVSLEFWVMSHPRQLRLEISDRGCNLSIGERQLICIARTLLRKSKVLVLDEATAHLDGETSRLVIEIFREMFEDSTILNITHRLAVMMKTDRTLVLDRGRVREFDTPAKLLKNSHGIFYAIAKNAGLIPNQPGLT